MLKLGKRLAVITVWCIPMLVYPDGYLDKFGKPVTDQA